MNDLREQIANELDTFRMVANARSRDGDDPMDVAWEFVPRLMALIAEAVLSEEAVEAGAIAQWNHNMIGDEPQWNGLDLGVKKIYREFTTVTAQAQLAAAGITPGDAREGVDGE